jgi:hypothetical protein
MTPRRSSLGLAPFGFDPGVRIAGFPLAASSRPGVRFITVTRSRRTDRMEAMLRDADASLERWFRGAKKGSASILRRRVDDFQAGLKKLSAGLEQLERDRTVTPIEQPVSDQKVTPRKRRTRPAIARKPSAARKHKKAA